jgi:hypothetical protein
MGIALNNFTTADGFTLANTLDAIPPCTRLTIDCYNNPIFWSVRICPQPIERAGVWQQEVFMGPSSKSIQRFYITGVRARSATVGKPAQVTFEGIPLGETHG